jgi:hypothetical protein
MGARKGNRGSRWRWLDKEIHDVPLWRRGKAGVVEDAGQWKVTVPRHVVASWVLQNLAFYPFSYSHVGVML